MPVSTPGIDWDTVKEDYLSGVKVSEVAAKYGLSYAALTQRAKRHNWSQGRRRILQGLETRIENAKNDIIATLSKATRETLARDINDSAITLSKVKQKRNLRHLKDRVDIQNKLAQASAPVFGWQNTSQSAVVNVNVLSFDKADSAPRAIDIPVIPAIPAKSQE